MTVPKRRAYCITLTSFLLTLAPVVSHASPKYSVQVGTYKVLVNAQKSLRFLEKKSHQQGKIVSVLHNNETYYRVEFGQYNQLKTANRAQANLKKYAQSAFIRKTYNASTHPTSNTMVTQKSIVPIAPKNSTVKAAGNAVVPAPKNAGVFQSIRSLSYSRFPYNARALADGVLSTKQSFFNSDLLVPLLGNNDSIAYLDGGGRVGREDSWFASLGTGMRGVQNNALWGGYFFVDYNRSTNNKSFLIGNLGLELFMSNWDSHLNGYVPMSSKSKQLGVFRGEEIGIPRAYFFQSHTFNEYLFDISDSTGPGVDGEVGYTLSYRNLRPFIGGYHFNINNGDTINGVEGGIELPLTNSFTLRLQDAYDKVQKNAFLATLRFTFGALPPSHDARSHMLDPFRRNLGSLQTGNGLPIVKTTTRLTRTFNTNNVWFFAPAGTAFNATAGFNNCTFENPCSEFSQAAIDGINTLAPNSNFFIDTGTYNNPIANSGFSLYNGQNMRGRTNQFLDPAFGVARPLINDTLTLPGNNILRNIHVNGNNNTDLTAIRVSTGAAGNISIINSLIEISRDNISSDLSGLISENNTATISLLNTDINTSLTNAPNFVSSGVSLANSGNFMMVGGSINTNGIAVKNIFGVNSLNTVVNLDNVTVDTNVDGDTQVASAAINLMALTATITNSRISLTGSDNTNPSVQLNAINNSANLTVLNSIVSVNANNYQATQVAALNTISSNNRLINSQFNIKANNSGQFIAAINSRSTNGILSLGNVKINIAANASGQSNGIFGIDSNTPISMYGSSVQVSSLVSNGVPVVGVQGQGPQNTIQYGNSRITLNANGTTSIAPVTGQATITNNGNVICTVNGISTNCP